MRNIRLLFVLGFLALGMLVTGFTFMADYHRTGLMNPVPRQKEYKKQWEKIDNLIKTGLPKSALDLTREIYQEAKSDGNHPQFIKALLYEIKLNSSFEEDFLVKTAQDIESEIEEAVTPAKQILHSILADIYWRYYQANRYKFMERTPMPGMTGGDIRTWDLKALLDQIITNYTASLANMEELQQTNLKAFNAIIQSEEDSKVYRPTLYDFLAHRAVDFFMNDEGSITRPADSFEIDKMEYFQQPQQFAALKLATEDSMSQKYYALQILQELIEFHQNEKDPVALIDVNLKRLQFVHNNAIISEKDSLYLASLSTFEKKHKTETASTEISYHMASLLNNQGQQYKPLVSDKYRLKIREAAEKCREAIDRFPKSDGAQNCSALLARIEQKNLQVKTPSVLEPGKPQLARLDYKNTPRVYFRLLKPGYEEDRQIQTEYRMRTDVLKKYATMESIKSWQISLPFTENYQPHTTEFIIPELSTGYYMMLASSSENFDVDNDYITYVNFWTSDISYISQHTNQNTYHFYTLSRQTGQPLAGVQAEMFYRKYDNRSREYSLESAGQYKSNADGFFEIPALEQSARPNSFYLDLKLKNDRLVTDDRYYHGRHTQPTENTQTRTWFFTDRAIYRPGQTIYYKGIVLDKAGNNYEIKPDYNTTIEFYDANYQKVSDMKLTTNEYGSFQGSFTAPQGVLNGSMTIRNETGLVSIQVEEYKRPNFEVTFDPVEGSYVLNERLELTGQAKAYNGSMVSNSKVKFRVVRRVHFPWRFWEMNYWPEESTTEIANGTTETDEDGKFLISFMALPDFQTPKQYKPMFTYVVNVDVTDINGETQSSETSVNVSYQSLFIDIALDDAVDRRDFNSVSFSTQNLNGQPVETSGNINIYKLKEPERLLNEQYWNIPDVFTIPESEYKTKFPHAVWKNENALDSLRVEKTLLTREFNSATDSVVMLDNSNNWQTGLYKVVISTNDVFGEKVEQAKYFTLYSTETKEPPVHKISWFKVIKDQCEPGEKAMCIIGTAADNVHVLFEVVRGDEVLESQWISLSNEQRMLEYLVTEELRGGFSMHCYFVKFNRSYQNTMRVEVPFTNKMLDFEFMTFRDKLMPGEYEEWQIKVMDKAGDSVAAEMLVNMFDASLDALAKKDWSFDLFGKIYSNLSWNFTNSFSSITGTSHTPSNLEHPKPVFRQYDRLNWFGFDYYGGYPVYKRGRPEMDMVMSQEALPGQMDGQAVTAFDEEVSTGETSQSGSIEPPAKEKGFSGIKVRRDFQETAFFFPELKTDSLGHVIFHFKTPESLTRWNFRGLAHTTDLQYGMFEKTAITQKQLMIIPNAPRFVRQGDMMMFSAKLVNLTDEELSGEVTLKFLETATMKDISDYILEQNNSFEFSLSGKENRTVDWQISIPDRFAVISYHVTAKAGNFTDGEEKPIPVLSNRMLVTESLPLPVKGKKKEKFTFAKLKNAETDGTLKNHKLTLEFSSNPAWYAVQALPYIMEKQTESANAVFSRFYANSIASHLVNSKPKVKQVFDVWKKFQPEALLSNLEKNQELKSLILQETPWVLDARTEKEQKHRIALLFDLNRMASEKSSALQKLQQKQSSGGGWPWFKGMPDNRYITQEIVLGFAKMKSLGVLDPMQDQLAKVMVAKAIRFLDQEMKDDYDYMLQHSKETMNEDHLSWMTVHYLLSRSHFMNEIPLSENHQEAFGFYRDQAKMYWNKQQVYGKGMIALALNNLGVKSAPSQIMASVKEHALYSDEMGMYFRDNKNGFYWYEAPVETQALLITAFDEILNDKKSVEQMKIWLLKQKQTQAWKTGKATADAVHALLLRGDDWLESDELVQIKIGDETIDPTKLEDTQVEAGTGYFKTSWSGSEIEPAMGNITVTNPNPSIAWGAVYWQYFEDLDKITPHDTPLQVEKKLFVQKNTKAGPVLEPVSEDSTVLWLGDKVIVRIEIRVDRDMEFVHMKDMRASAFEPVNVLSGYRYQGGLGYYESRLDASTNFFFDYLPKGTYVFEYPLVASQTGNFSNGITTLQCMYAPEFASHSEGVRVTVE